MTSHVFIVSLLLFCFQPLDFLSSFPHHRHHSDVEKCLEKYFLGRNHTILYVFVCLPITSCESLAIKLRYLGVSVVEVSLFSGQFFACVCVCAHVESLRKSEASTQTTQLSAWNFVRKLCPSCFEDWITFVGFPLAISFFDSGIWMMCHKISFDDELLTQGWAVKSVSWVMRHWCPNFTALDWFNLVFFHARNWVTKTPDSILMIALVRLVFFFFCNCNK